VVLDLWLRNLDVERRRNSEGELVGDVVPAEDVALLDDGVVAATKLEDGSTDNVLVLRLREGVPEQLCMVVMLVEALRTETTTGTLELVRREGEDVGVDLGELGDGSLVLDKVLLVLTVGAADGRNLEAVGRVVGSGRDAVLVLAVADCRKREEGRRKKGKTEGGQERGARGKQGKKRQRGHDVTRSGGTYSSR
jgi:hypothetical protein